MINQYMVSKKKVKRTGISNERISSIERSSQMAEQQLFKGKGTDGSASKGHPMVARVDAKGLDAKGLTTSLVGN